ncbi:MAG: hypothetical protein U0441_05500 [Polyangiaceae bacterium]
MSSLTSIRSFVDSRAAALALVAAASALACAPTIRAETDSHEERSDLWSKRFGDAGPQVATSVAVGPKGRVTVAGYFGDSVDLENGPLPNKGVTDLFVGSFDKDGHPLWSESFGGAGGDSLPGRTFAGVDSQGRVTLVAPRAGEIDFGLWPIPALGYYDTVVAGLSADGKPLWNKRFGDQGRYTLTSSMAVSPAGHIVIAGNFSGTVDFGTGPLTNSQPSCTACANAAFVVEMDALGNTLWARTFESDSWPDGIVLPQAAFDASGRVVLAGTLRGPMEINDGAPPIPSAGDNPTLFLLGFDEQGDVDFRTSFPVDGDLWVSSVAASADGRIAITGNLEGSIAFDDHVIEASGHLDFYAATFSAGGKPLRATASAADGDQAPPTGIFDESGNLVVLAPFTSAVALGADKLDGLPSSVLVGRIAPSGDITASVLGASEGDATSRIGKALFALDGADRLLVTGSFQGAVDFGSGALTSQGDDDAFLARAAF